MAGKRMRSRGVGSVVDRGLLFKRIQELEGVVDIYDVGCVVEHLRELYRDYGSKKLIPFTHCVQQALEGYRHRQRRQQAKHKEGGDDEGMNEATPSSRSPKRFKMSSAASSSSSSVGSADEDAVFDMEVKPDYSKSRQQPVSSRPKREEDVQEDNAVDRKLLRATEFGVTTPVSSGQGDGRGAELVGCKGKDGPRFRDFGGIEGILDELMMEVRAWCPSHIWILLHGPPGCGKTKLAQAIANETGVPFYKISATEIVSGVSGEGFVQKLLRLRFRNYELLAIIDMTGASEENIRELFKRAYRTAPSIVFIDEIDAIGSKRDNLQREMEKRIVTQLMTCMDESHQALGAADAKLDVEPSEKKPGYVLVIGATNRPDAVDPALRRPGRFDHEIFLGVPDEKARREILSVLTEKLKLDGALDLSKIARATSGFAGNLAMRRIIIRRKSELPAESTEDQHVTWWRQPWTPDEIEKLGISMVDFEEAAKLVLPSSRREGFSSIPAVKWEDVGGLDSLRKDFDRHIIQRVKHPEKYEPPQCFLFSILPTFSGVRIDIGSWISALWPPGCGKTLIAKAVANEAGANFIHIKVTFYIIKLELFFLILGSRALEQVCGESELAVRTIFGRARICSPCILFFDEIDALTMRRGKDGDSVVDRLLMQLLIELDGADQRHGVFIIGATNRPEAIDPAILRPGRLGKVMYVPLPSPDERALILKTLARRKPLAPDSAMVALDEKEGSVDQGSGPSVIKTSHFEQALMKISPSVSMKRRKYYEDLSKHFKAA
ncbi:unnamed protein product [Spirodela intermedia]|uniref:AAA+ ATPase domain-containing protein n=1 Tax=Spirodela intermedia TaxID=51605 RepID=A0A7I8JK11_SPIIN|nr:unnamed protein product [Spirodela intermedia]CAA6670516.1 unnamed protein product [Spirodela intermedia]